MIIEPMFIVSACLTVSVLLNIYQFFAGRRKEEWYASILDAMPFPLSVTDTNMNWTFINRAVENMLSKNRKDMIGKHCSNWGAGICKTENCGISCLRHGITQTRFQQMGMNFQVHVAHLIGTSGRNFGHVEVVQDISSMVQMETTAADMVQEITGTQSHGIQLVGRSSEVTHVSSISELSETISDIAGKMAENSKAADRALRLSDVMRQNTMLCNQKMEQMVTAVQEIDEASQAIRKVIKIIDDIAFQTNILSLNAAVEAARAGDAGKSFAIVADEVRRLSAQSTSAANNTSDLISNSIHKAELGSQIAMEAAEALKEIVASIDTNSQLIGDIAHSSDQQSSDITRVDEGIKRIHKSVQSYLNAASR